MQEFAVLVKDDDWLMAAAVEYVKAIFGIACHANCLSGQYSPGQAMPGIVRFVYELAAADEI
jgi:hypothetical protein